MDIGEDESESVQFVLNKVSNPKMKQRVKDFFSKHNIQTP